MTREEAIEVLEKMKYPQKVNKNGFVISNVDIDNEALEMAIKALSQEPTTPMSTFAIAKQFGIKLEPCDDAISRQAVINAIENDCMKGGLGSCFACYNDAQAFRGEIEKLPSVTQKSNTGHCKECKYFEYDSVAKIDGIPLIVAHEICNKWGGGCKSSEDGYCYLFEPQESEE